MMQIVDLSGLMPWLYFCGNFLLYIQIGPRHTVCYDSCRVRYHQPILLHFQLAALPLFDYWIGPISVQIIAE